MNKKNIIISFCCVLFFALFNNLFAQNDISSWNYPIRSGTSEWEQLNSFSEKLQAFNIPEKLLLEMPTENLVKTCLNYPWWILITSRDNNQDGYLYLKNEFNGFRELENREDAGKYLIEAYLKMQPENVKQCNTLIKQGLFSFRFTLIEIILAQPNVLKKLGDNQIASLVNKASSVYKTKSLEFDSYSYYGVTTSCLILSRILELKENDHYQALKMNYPKLDNFNSKGNSQNIEMLNTVVQRVNNIYKNE